jgi:hypothetical protein
MAQRFLMYLFLASLLSACAGARVTPPAPDSRTASVIEEAGAVLDSVTEDTRRIYAEQGTLRGELLELTSRPEWTEMEAIILATPSARLLEGDYLEDMKNSGEVKAWVRKWNKPWKPIFQDYVKLADRCSIVEARRTALKSRIIEVQVKYLVAAEAAERAGNVDLAKALVNMVDILSDTVTELDGFTLNEVGLYSVSSRS